MKGQKGLDKTSKMPYVAFHCQQVDDFINSLEFIDIGACHPIKMPESRWD